MIVAVTVNSFKGIFIKAHNPDLTLLSQGAYTQAGSNPLKVAPSALMSRNDRLFVAGSFDGILDPRGTGQQADFLMSDGTPDAFVEGYKYSVIGSPQQAKNVLLWGKGYGGAPSGSQSVLAIASGLTSAVDAVFVTGQFDTSMNLADPDQEPFTAHGGKDTFIAALSMLDGKTLWSKQLGGSGDQSGTAIAFDLSSKAVLVGGSFQGEVDLGGGLLQNGDGFDHVFLARFDDKGAHQWSKSFGEGGAQAIQSVALLGNNVFVAGSYKGAIDFGCKGLVNDGPTDRIFVARLRPVGF